MEEKIYEKVKEHIYKNDKLFEFLGAEITDMGEGLAEVEMEVKENHLNAAKICQGGVIFTLADLAFALASNSYGTLALAINANITYIKPVNLGEKLVARAQEFHKGKNLATYHITVFKKDTKEKVAFFEGMVYRLDKPFI
ncbi:MAG: esterase [Thermodesulfobacterium geofontis]|uniref:Esterase n=1 Tax=Thermodesulfobacterium geofontis TaxID=1295609 RepID=A0A2N7PPV1_9BACT|nr:MAG: esterase [Thermodesulfobacterium geofontis]PMP94209.1 MAG: esterase [Thermodesulfobacterium geofontis]